MAPKERRRASAQEEASSIHRKQSELADTRRAREACVFGLVVLLLGVALSFVDQMVDIVPAILSALGGTVLGGGISSWIGVEQMRRQASDQAASVERAVQQTRAETSEAIDSIMATRWEEIQRGLSRTIPDLVRAGSTPSTGNLSCLPDRLEDLRREFVQFHRTRDHKGGPIFWMKTEVDFSRAHPARLVADEELNTGSERWKYSVEGIPINDRLILLHHDVSSYEENVVVDVFKRRHGQAKQWFGLEFHMDLQRTEDCAGPIILLEKNHAPENGFPVPPDAPVGKLDSRYTANLDEHWRTFFFQVWADLVPASSRVLEGPQEIYDEARRLLPHYKLHCNSLLGPYPNDFIKSPGRSLYIEKLMEEIVKAEKTEKTNTPYEFRVHEIYSGEAEWKDLVTAQKAELRRKIQAAIPEATEKTDMERYDSVELDPAGEQPLLNIALFLERRTEYGKDPEFPPELAVFGWVHRPGDKSRSVHRCIVSSDKQIVEMCKSQFYHMFSSQLRGLSMRQSPSEGLSRVPSSNRRE